ncbi:sigma-70 family RNA polymerase sigma factor, partial [Pseudoalteromonas sp. Angola-31]|nr:sigma-70 family RNA polymerase sigma factor [Pseudoalteromonas sp. Angola-31]
HRPISIDILLQDHIQDHSVPIEDSYTQKEEVAELVSAMSQLPKKEYQVLVLYYYEELKMHEIAKVMELSESYISRLASSATSRLRGIISSNKHLKKVKS